MLARKALDGSLPMNGQQHLVKLFGATHLISCGQHSIGKIAAEQLSFNHKTIIDGR